MSRRAIAAALGLISVLSGAAGAQQTSDSLTVTITPNAYYAVSIDTSSGGLDLGLVNLGASTQTVLPATVTVNSTYAKTDLTLIGFTTTTLGIPWTFDDNTTTSEADKLAMWAVFTDTSIVTPPTQGSGGAFSNAIPGLDDSDVVDATAQAVGDTSTVQRRFVLSSTAPGYMSMEDIPAFAADPAASRSKLWLKFRLPASSTSNTTQKIIVTLTAGAPN